MNGNKLRAYIISAGYTQGKLAKEIGISPNTMSAKLNGRSPFDTIEIERICTVLGITSNREKADIFLSQSSQQWDESEQNNLCARPQPPG